MIGLELQSDSCAPMMWRPLERGVTSVGRNPECDICIPQQDVPAVQCILRWQGAELTLLNRSSEGTRVGDEIAHGELRLADGDAIAVGSMRLLVRFSQQASRSARTRTLGTQVVHERHLLIRMSGVSGVHYWDVGPSGLSFGTDASNDVVLDDPYVSAFHARLTLEAGRWLMRDLASRNGVFLDGRKIESAEVGAGSTIKLGQTKLVLQEPAESSNPPGFDAVPRMGQAYIGDTPAAQRVRELVARMADSDAPVLVTGETGTGKEVVARMLAAHSARSHRPFIALNCGALGRHLVESELFGHEKGAFTGAIERKKGAFEAAHHGTLFLDEIGELPLELQPQLLRVLETGEVRRVGSSTTFTVNVRLIAATNRDLMSAIQEGTFRSDLFHRLHVLAIQLPSLRERPQDTPLLAEYFLHQFLPPQERCVFSEEAVEALMRHDFPGNVRELRNVIQRAVLLRKQDVLSAEDMVFLPSTQESRAEVANAMGPKTLLEMERDAIIAELERHNGNKRMAAHALGIARSTIHRKIEEFGIDTENLKKKN